MPLHGAYHQAEAQQQPTQCQLLKHAALHAMRGPAPLAAHLLRRALEVHRLALKQGSQRCELCTAQPAAS